MKSYINGFGREKSFGNGQGRGQETHRMQVPGTVISGDKCSQLKGCVKPGGEENVSNNYYVTVVS